MDITIPKITEKIQLSNYAPEFGDQWVSVWVNPPRKVMVDLTVDSKGTEEPIDDTDIERFLSALAKVWDWSVEDIKKLKDDGDDANPYLFTWLIRETVRHIAEYRLGIKKNWMQPFGAWRDEAKPASP